MKHLSLLLSLFVLSMLAGCGGGGGSSTTAGTISGAVVKGPVGNATVTAYAISNGMQGAQIGTTTTNASGNFNLSMGSYTGPVMLQMSGGTYTDEATGTTAMTMAPGDVMTSIMPTVTAGATVGGIQVTPLTSMAQTMAQHLTGGMTDANITAANTAIGNYFTVNDILHTSPMNPLISGSGTGATQDMKNYGMALAAISQYAQTQGMISSSGMVTAMMSDAADGKLNGMTGSTTVMMGGMSGMSTAMPVTAGTTGLGAAMSTFIANAQQNKSGVTASDMQPLMDKLNASTGQMLGTSPPAMVNATVSGTAFNGPVSKGTVMAYALNNGIKGAQIASVATDPHGSFTLPLGSYSGPVMLQMSGGTYTDEATGTTLNMVSTDVMTTVMPTIASGAAVTGV